MEVYFAGAIVSGCHAGGEVKLAFSSSFSLTIMNVKSYDLIVPAPVCINIIQFLHSELRKSLTVA
jgi:hypothetical protein